MSGASDKGSCTALRGNKEKEMKKTIDFLAQLSYWFLETQKNENELKTKRTFPKHPSVCHLQGLDHPVVVGFSQ